MSVHFTNTGFVNQAYDFIDEKPLKILSAHVGVELNGIDLSRGINQSLMELIQNLLCKYLVVVIPNQALSALQQADITAAFGEVEKAWNNNNMHQDHDNVFLISNERLKENPNFISPTFYWHWDRSWTTTPTSISVAHFISEPQPEGFGMTQFANLYEAYNDLSEIEKSRISNLSVIHSYNHMNTIRELNYEKVALKFIKGEEKFEDVTHQLVRHHPITNRLVLNLDELYQCHIPTLGNEESALLRKNLLMHATQDKYIYTHIWRKGDLILWDNLALIHRAIPSHPTISRILQRTSTADRKPFEIRA